MIVRSCSHVLLSIGQVSKVLVKFLVTLLVILVSQFILVAKIVSMVSGNFFLWTGISFLLHLWRVGHWQVPGSLSHISSVSDTHVVHVVLIAMGLTMKAVANASAFLTCQPICWRRERGDMIFAKKIHNCWFGSRHQNLLGAPPLLETLLVFHIWSFVICHRSLDKWKYKIRKRVTLVRANN